MIQLYRYFGSHAFETLRDCRLMMAIPSTLNDPFEFLYRTAPVTLAKARKYIQRREKSDTFYLEAKKNNPDIKNKKAALGEFRWKFLQENDDPPNFFRCKAQNFTVRFLE